MNQQEVRVIIKETVHETLSGLGFTIDNPHQVQQDMIFLRKKRNNSEGILNVIKKTVVTIVVTSCMYFIINKVLV